MNINMCVIGTSGPFPQHTMLFYSHCTHCTHCTHPLTPWLAHSHSTPYRSCVLRDSRVAQSPLLTTRPQRLLPTSCVLLSTALLALRISLSAHSTVSGGIFRASRMLFRLIGRLQGFG